MIARGLWIENRRRRFTFKSLKRGVRFPEKQHHKLPRALTRQYAIATAALTLQLVPLSVDNNGENSVRNVARTKSKRICTCFMLKCRLEQECRVRPRLCNI